MHQEKFELLSKWGDDDEWSHYGNHTWEELQEREKYTKLDKPIEDLESDLLKELSSGFSSFNADIQESSSTEVVLASGKDQALSAKQALEQANRKLAIFQGLLNRQKNHLYSIKREYENRLETITKVVDIIELYLGVYEEIVQISEGEY